MIALRLSISSSMSSIAWRRRVLGGRIATAQHRGQGHAQPAERLERLVVQLPGPAATLGVGGGDRATQPVRLDAAVRRPRCAAGSEGAQQLLVLGGERRGLGPAVERREHAQPRPAVEHRDQQRRARVGTPRPPARSSAGRRHRRSAPADLLEHPPDGRVATGIRRPWAPPQSRARRHDELSPSRSMISTVRASTRARPRLTISSRMRSRSDSPLTASRYPVSPRASAPLARAARGALAALVEPGVLDRRRRPLGEDHRGLLVLRR